MSNKLSLLFLLTTVSLWGQFSTTASRITRGNGVPNSANCQTLADVGKVYYRQDAAATFSSFYSCSQTGSGVFAWELNGGSGGGGGALAPIAFSGNPNTGSVACPATSANPVVSGIDTTTQYQWFCGWSGASTTAWYLLSSSIGSGTYALSGVTGTVNLDLAANRPATPADGYLFCATDTFAFSQYSTILGWSGTLNATGHAVAAYTPTGLAYYLPGSCTPTASGGVTITSPNGTVTVGGTSTAPTLDANTVVVAQKFFGTAAPGSVTGNLPGDLFSDTTNHNIYQCNATSGTAAPACTSVTAGGWTLLNSGGSSAGSKLLASYYPSSITTMTGSDVNLFSPVTVPAMPSGQCIRLSMGKLTHTSGSATITYKIKIDGTSIGANIGVSAAATAAYLFGYACGDGTGASVQWTTLAANLLGYAMVGSAVSVATGTHSFVLTASGTAGDAVTVQNVMVEFVQ